MLYFSLLSRGEHSGIYVYLKERENSIVRDASRTKHGNKIKAGKNNCSLALYFTTDCCNVKIELQVI